MIWRQRNVFIHETFLQQNGVVLKPRDPSGLNKTWLTSSFWAYAGSMTSTLNSKGLFSQIATNPVFLCAKAFTAQIFSCIVPITCDAVHPRPFSLAGHLSHMVTMFSLSLWKSFCNQSSVVFLLFLCLRCYCRFVSSVLQFNESYTCVVAQGIVWRTKSVSSVEQVNLRLVDRRQECFFFSCRRSCWRQQATVYEKNIVTPSLCRLSIFFSKIY